MPESTIRNSVCQKQINQALFKEIAESKFPFYLVGNKCDLDNTKQISKHKIDQFIELHGLASDRVFQTSAETGVGVEELFNH